ncbi:MAG: tRNA 2-selenouridine(34) synthase MnmH, partial [Burkholderiales bacterium]
RARIGTIYTRESTFTAKRLGAALVSRNIARHLDESFADKPRTWRPLVYCWRGGQRSHAMTIVLRQVGWDARRLAGGYKAYRRHVVEEIDRLAPSFDYRIVCGLTGSGKSELLRALRAAGAQVLDLEALAAHRGSLLGDLPGEPQPSQKMFESRLLAALAATATARPLFVEAESKKIGNLRVPQSLIARLWQSDCVLVRAEPAARLTLLLREYAHFTRDFEGLNARLDCLVPLHGRARIEHWKVLARAGDWPQFVHEVLEDHYDPAYRKSTLAHFPRLAHATTVPIATGSAEEYASAAYELLDCSVAPARPASTAALS